MTPDEARELGVNRWLTRSRKDLRSAAVLLSVDPPEVADGLFHLQQALEKAAKAALTAADVPFRRTHDLVGLGRAMRGIAPDLAGRVEEIAPLGALAVALRYPSPEEEPPPEEAREALVRVGELVDAIAGWLDRRLGPDEAQE